MGFIDIYGDWTIIPSRFRTTRNTTKADFNINCEYQLGGGRYIVHSGDSLNIGGKLEFTIQSKGQLIEPLDANL